MKTIKEKVSLLLFLLARKFVYGMLFLFSSISPRTKVIILCYHSVGNDSWRYTVSLENLTRQMVYMLKHYDPVTLDDVVKYIRGEITFSRPVFVVTFDDGYADILQTTEMFSHFGIHPTAFVLSHHDEADQKELTTEREFLTDEQMIHLLKLGWSVGSHGATHRDFYTLEQNSSKKELDGSKKTLEKALGRSVDYFAYPKGRYTSVVIKNLNDAGYTAGFSMDDAYITSKTDLTIIPRIGVDRTHSMVEFEATISPTAIFMRSIVKNINRWFVMRKQGSYVQ